MAGLRLVTPTSKKRRSIPARRAARSGEPVAGFDYSAWPPSLGRVAQLELSLKMLTSLDRFSRREEIDLPPHIVARKVLEAFLRLSGA
jgi:hypothetical protein